MKIVYCHGLPGSGAEIEGLIPGGISRPYVLSPLDKTGFDAIAKDHPGGVHIIGFSLGAMTAIQMTATRPLNVKKLTLIAPAAPLELGDFLPHMAGKFVFKMAQRGALPFKLFTAFQRLGVNVAPDRVIKTMFDGSPAPDMKLLSDPRFIESLKAGLTSSLSLNTSAYHEAVLAYVKPWALFLKDIQCPVTLHHGSKDNWAPIEMSCALKDEISAPAKLITYDDLGHYSTLHRVLPDVLKTP